MSGKPYTMKEMKGIVDYVTERKAFSEIKGRKMWMDFASSKLTARTWQSLKETFLKRILPDIHNPYYKLTVDQIRCFREGKDVIAREKNKLEIYEVEDDLNVEKESEKVQPSTSHVKNGAATTGEDIKCEKIQSHNRASVDTVIIPNCYETDEDLRRVLESELSPNSANNEKPQSPPSKSLRDLITYSEPLTPMLQEVLNDFASEDESDGELRMQIVENDVVSDSVNPNEEAVIEIFDSDDVIDKNNAIEDILVTENTVDNAAQKENTENNVNNNDIENNTQASKATENNLNEDNATKENLNKEENTDNIDTKIAETDKSSNAKAKDHNKEDIVEKQTSKDISNDNMDKETEISQEKDKPDKNVDPEEFIQPKVLSLKLRKRREVAVKVPVKNTSTKARSNKELYEIVEHEILEKSTNAVPKVDTLSNYATNKDDVVSSTVSDKTTQNSTTSDTILPNNQEALQNSGKRSSNESTLQNISKSPDLDKPVKPKNSRKRASSQDVASISNVKKNKSKVDTNKKAVSDTDDIVMKKLIKSKLTKSKLELKKKDVFDEVEKDIEKSNENSKTDNKEISQELPESVPTTSKPVMDCSQASELNPCLKSVSLFAEQFNTNSYIDSESSEHETTPAASATDNRNKPSTSKSNKGKDVGPNIEAKKNDKVTKVRATAMNVDEVVMLKSHSESESEGNKVSSQKKKLPSSQEIAKAQRDKALANIFGFYSGSMKRKKRLSYRKHSAYHQRREESSCDSSEWTSESDSEAYVSPPRGRKNKQTRKYLKPHSARIHSLEDEGGLFVMYGKKIYPLVKDGKIMKNYLTYLPESDPEEEESYWKLKYVEERKRVAELKKLMKENSTEVSREKSPILPARSLRNVSTSNNQGSPFKAPTNPEISNKIMAPPEKERTVENETGKTLKITFARNNQEVHVEGHWSNIHPVLAEVVQFFNKEDAAWRPSDASESVAVVPSPVDEGIPKIELLEKVNKLETEIFKEIENRDQEEDIEQTKEQTENNVTKRKRASRVRKSTSTQRSTSSTRSPKRQKTTTDEPKEPQTPNTRSKKDSKTDIEEKQKKDSKEVEVKEKKVSKTDLQENKKKDSKMDLRNKAEVTKDTIEAVDSATSVASKSRSRTPKKDAKEAETTTEVNTRSRRSKPQDTKDNSSQVEDDSEIRYMLPPSTRSRKSSSNLSKSKRYMANPPKHSSPHLSIHDESTQGYQDSDISPPKLNLRRKRKLSLSTVLHRNKTKSLRLKRRSFSCITDKGSSDSNSAFQIIVRPTNNSSLKSEAYRSDSYQLLFPQNKNVFRPLEKIDEHFPIPNNSLHPNIANLDSRERTIEISINQVENTSSSNSIIDGGNSSNVSLPMSPELSIVEKLSISKDLINSVENYPTINEMQANNTSTKEILNKYLISQVDISMPLMQQECGLHESIRKKIKSETSPDKMSIVSDSIVNKSDAVNQAEAPSLSDSLDTRLRNLLLESAKKMSIPSIREVDIEKLVGKDEPQKKGKPNKRCSTPRKKKDLKKAKVPIVEPVVEEEFTESCSYGGRKSCPPAIQVICEDSILTENVDAGKDIVPEKNKGRKKKDIIKVKILRPRNKSLQSRSPVVTRNTSKMTVNTDSGINESGLTVQGLNDSVDLIHNHSETCLLANECMGDSIEFIETNTKSIISLTTDSAASPDRNSVERLVFEDCHDFVPDMFCQNAQSFCNVDYVPESAQLITDNISDTVYHSPLASEVSMNSLITEDLSDETPQGSQSTKWYLLSEDDTSHTNAASRSTTNSIPSSFGANLKQIFPITCAVPDLSTITEMSGENSRKHTLESVNSTRHDLDSQSMFDINSNYD